MTSYAWPTSGSGSSGPEIENGNLGASFTINLSKSSAQAGILNANCTLTLSNAQSGNTYVLRLTQDATGGRTVTWPAAVKWPAGTAPTLSAAGKTDVIPLYYDGTNFYGGSLLNF